MCDVTQVGLISLIFVSLLALILVLVMLTMLGLKRRCGKAEVYRPVYSCGEGGTSDMLYTAQPSSSQMIAEPAELLALCGADAPFAALKEKLALPAPPPAPKR